MRATPRGGGDHREPDPAPWQAKDISVGHSPGVDEPARPSLPSGAPACCERCVREPRPRGSCINSALVLKCTPPVSSA